MSSAEEDALRLLGQANDRAKIPSSNTMSKTKLLQVSEELHSLSGAATEAIKKMSGAEGKLKQRVDSWKNTMAEWTERVALLLQKHTIIDEMKERAEERLLEAARINTGKITALQQDTSRLESELLSERESKRLVEQTLAEARVRIIDLESHADRLQSRAERADDLQKKGDDLHFQLVRLSEQVAQCKEQVTGLEAQVMDLGVWSENLITDLATTESARERARTMLQRQIGAWKTRAKKSFSEMSQAARERPTFESDIRSKVAALQQDFATQSQVLVNTELHKRQELMNEYTKQLDERESRLLAERELRISATKAAEQARAEMEALDDALRQSQCNYEVLRKQHETGEADLEEMRRSKRRLSETMVVVSGCLHQLLKELTDVTGGSPNGPGLARVNTQAINVGKRADVWRAMLETLYRDLDNALGGGARRLSKDLWRMVTSGGTSSVIHSTIHSARDKNSARSHNADGDEDKKHQVQRDEVAKKLQEHRESAEGETRALIAQEASSQQRDAIQKRVSKIVDSISTRVIDLPVVTPPDSRPYSPSPSSPLANLIPISGVTKKVAQRKAELATIEEERDRLYSARVRQHNDRIILEVNSFSSVEKNLTG